MPPNELAGLLSHGQTSPGPECPEESVWLEVAAKLLPPDREESLLRHSVTCDCCAFRLREAAQLIDEPLSAEQESLADRLPTWRQTAASVSKGEKRRPQAFFLQKWGALAAAFLLVVLGVWQTEPRLTAWWDERSVAQEFRHSRPGEFRVSGVPYGPAEVELGGSQSVKLPPSQSADPKDLRLAARKAFLEKDASRALTLLNKVRAQGDSSPAVLNDLAVANAMLGNRLEAEGLLKEILRDRPNEPAALFNLALLQEMANRRQEASDTARKLQSAEPNSPWSQELRRTLGQADSRR